MILDTDRVAVPDLNGVQGIRTAYLIRSWFCPKLIRKSINCNFYSPHANRNRDKTVRYPGWPTETKVMQTVAKAQLYCPGVGSRAQGQDSRGAGRKVLERETAFPHPF